MFASKVSNEAIHGLAVELTYSRQLGKSELCLLLEEYSTQLLLFIPLSTNTFQTLKSKHLENLAAAFPFQGFGQDHRHMCLERLDSVIMCFSFVI